MHYDVILIQFDALHQPFFYFSSVLIPNCFPASLGDVSFASSDDLIGDFDQQGGYSFRSVVMMRNIIDHLHNMDHSHQ